MFNTDIRVPCVDIKCLYKLSAGEDFMVGVLIHAEDEFHFEFIKDSSAKPNYVNYDLLKNEFHFKVGKEDKKYAVVTVTELPATVENKLLHASLSPIKKKGDADFLASISNASDLNVLNLANLACITHDAMVLKMHKEIGIMPDVFGANCAFKNRDMEILEWLACNNIFPSLECIASTNATLVQDDKHIDNNKDLYHVINYLIRNAFPVNQDFIDQLFLKRDVNTTKYLLNQGYIPSKRVITNLIDAQAKDPNCTLEKLTLLQNHIPGQKYYVNLSAIKLFVTEIGNMAAIDPRYLYEVNEVGKGKSRVGFFAYFPDWNCRAFFSNPEFLLHQGGPVALKAPRTIYLHDPVTKTFTMQHISKTGKVKKSVVTINQLGKKAYSQREYRHAAGFSTINEPYARDLRNPCIPLATRIANLACIVGSVKILEKYKTLGALPTEHGANYAFINRKLSSLYWCATNGIFPSQDIISKFQFSNDEILNQKYSYYTKFCPVLNYLETFDSERASGKQAQPKDVAYTRSLESHSDYICGLFEKEDNEIRPTIRRDDQYVYKSITLAETEILQKLLKRGITPEMGIISCGSKHVAKMERYTGTLTDWINTNPSLEQVKIEFPKIINLFLRLGFEFNIRHGDVHGNNVVYRSNADGTTDWRLIDFEFSKIHKSDSEMWNPYYDALWISNPITGCAGGKCWDVELLGVPKQYVDAFEKESRDLRNARKKHFGDAKIAYKLQIDISK